MPHDSGPLNLDETSIQADFALNGKLYSADYFIMASQKKQLRVSVITIAAISICIGSITISPASAEGQGRQSQAQAQAARKYLDADASLRVEKYANGAAFYYKGPFKIGYADTPGRCGFGVHAKYTVRGIIGGASYEIIPISRADSDGCVGIIYRDGRANHLELLNFNEDDTISFTSRGISKCVACADVRSSPRTGPIAEYIPTSDSLVRVWTWSDKRPNGEQSKNYSVIVRIVGVRAHFVTFEQIDGATSPMPDTTAVNQGGSIRRIAVNSTEHFKVGSWIRLFGGLPSTTGGGTGGTVFPRLAVSATQAEIDADHRSE